MHTLHIQHAHILRTTLTHTLTHTLLHAHHTKLTHTYGHNTHTHGHTHMHAWTYTHMDTHIRTHTNTDTCTHAWTHTHTHLAARAHSSPLCCLEGACGGGGDADQGGSKPFCPVPEWQDPTSAGPGRRAQAVCAGAPGSHLQGKGGQEGCIHLVL